MGNLNETQITVIMAVSQVSLVCVHVTDSHFGLLGAEGLCTEI